MEMDKTTASTARSRGSKSSTASNSKRENSAPEGPKPAVQGKIDASSSKETVDAEFNLEKLRSEKKRYIRTKQLNRYAMAMYGSPQEKEELRYNINGLELNLEQGVSFLCKGHEKESVNDTTPSIVFENSKTTIILWATGRTIMYIIHIIIALACSYAVAWGGKYHPWARVLAFCHNWTFGAVFIIVLSCTYGGIS